MTSQQNQKMNVPKFSLAWIKKCFKSTNNTKTYLLEIGNNHGMATGPKAWQPFCTDGI